MRNPFSANNHQSQECLLDHEEQRPQSESLAAGSEASISPAQSPRYGQRQSLNWDHELPGGALSSNLNPNLDAARQRHRHALKSLEQEMSRCLAILPGSLTGSRWEQMLKLALNLLHDPSWAKEYFLPSASVESADVLCTTMGGLQQMLASNALLTKPVLVRASPDDTFHENTAWAEFIERLEDCYDGAGFLDVQDPSLPVSSYSARRMTFKDFSDAVQARSGMELDNARLPLNLLNLRDFLSLPEPPFARMSRFQLLQTLDARIESAMVPDAPSAGKKIVSRYSDAASCSRFLLFACRGAISGFHVNLLMGTWVQAVSGRKAWPIITNLSDEERLEFQKHGGMFWDEKRAVDIIESVS